MKKTSTVTLMVLLSVVILFAPGNAERMTPQKIAITKTPLASQEVSIEATKVDLNVALPPPAASRGEAFVGRQGGDNFLTATVIPTLPFTSTGTTVGYNDDYDPAEGGCSPTFAPDVVYAHYATRNQRVDIKTCNTGTDYWTKLIVYQTDTTTAYACNQYSEDCFNSTSQYRADIFGLWFYAGETYYIAVDGGPGGVSGNYELTIDTLPAITPSGEHPGFDRGGWGLLTLAFEDTVSSQPVVLWTASPDEGDSWLDAVYWGFANGVARYPNIDYWSEDTVFFGSVVPPPEYYNGGPTFLIQMNNGGDPSGYLGMRWPWNEYGWHDMKMADIACCGGFEDWRFGFHAYVHSSTYTGPLVDAPHIFYPTDETGGMISWLNGVNGCGVSRADIDRATYRGYFVYDWYDTDSAQWCMVNRQKRFDDLEDTLFAGAWIWHLSDGVNFQYPAVAANESNVLIVAEIWDETTPDDKDILCYSTTNGDLEDLDSVTVVAATVDAERYPEIEPISGTTFLCTFIKNNTLYGAISIDGGINWSDPPIQLSEVGDSVVNDYQGHKITESDGYFVKIIYEYYDKGESRAVGDVRLRIIDFEATTAPDADQDGVKDPQDNCPTEPNPEQEDYDFDGVGDSCDNCPNDRNRYQEDSDQDEVGDACDNCPDDPNTDQADIDQDNVGNVCDNCPDDPNTDQQNSDNDTYGDACDNCPQDDNEDQADDDQDDVGNVCDNCPEDPNTDQANNDLDTLGNVCDNCPDSTNNDQSDVDEDGWGDVCDNCPDDYNPDQLDSNGNGVGDVCDWICGDVDGTRSINMLDILYLIAYLYKGGPAPPVLDAADVNNSGSVDMLDILHLIAYLYKGGPDPDCG